MDRSAHTADGRQYPPHAGDGTVARVSSAALRSHSAQRAEKVARSRLERQATLFAKEGRRKVTRTISESQRNEQRLAGNKRRHDRWEARALQELFGIDSDSDSGNSALGEALTALDSADDEVSGCGNGDSDYEEKPQAQTNDSGGDDSSDDTDDGERERVSSQGLTGVGVDEASEIAGLSEGEIAHTESTASTEFKPKAHRTQVVRGKETVPA
ncbi:hypothetical protein PI124_g7526 [Phytophthora idaei]|nr:hypothetical protein PI125_g2504 [Phytophthora idaei]KAG3170966.1 hypothetical protein PI126_g2111 [Phytophthora idaei]KAG3247773.1 hypothetical protein PI124_g7526 [Phytophthora idaei]